MVALLCLYGCQDNEGNPDEQVPGAVQFSLNDPDEGNRGNAAGAEAYEDARSLIVTIEDDQGNVVYDQEQIELFNFSGTLAGEPLSLNPGNYQLTEFLVLNDQGEVIYATPIEGSEYAHLVNDPLPIDFIITTDQTTQVVPEVIDTEEFTPDAFGYATFQFNIVEHFSFLITAFAYDETAQKLVPTTAALTIYEQGTQNDLYNGQLGDSTNAIAVEDGVDYRLVIEKAGFSVSEDYTNAGLKAFANDPLEVVLQSVVPMPSLSFINSGEVFSNLSAASVKSGDLNGDGYDDLFITRTNSQVTEVLINDGTGSYPEIKPVGTFPSTDVELGDFDGDGDLDAFITNWSEQPNTVWLNDGAGNFTDSGQAFGNVATNGVELGDLDNDGDLDAIIVDYYNLPILLNDGNGVFTEVAQITGSLEASDVSLGDLNGDGNLDVFVANSGPTVGRPDLVFFNDGAANFTDGGQSVGNDKSLEVVLADLDGDSDLDAFVGTDQEPIKIWFNDGTGTFTVSGQGLGNSKINDVILVDFDLDGDLDALTVTGNGQPHTLWWNGGNGNFTHSSQPFGSSNSGGLTSGDFDRDGDIDVYIAIGGAPDVLWLGQQN